MSQSKVSILVILIAIVAALCLRLPRLSLRTMHTDEAVHAIKFAELLEDGDYKYDRHEYHGPTLNYFTLITARLFGQNNLAELTETTLRIVPVFFGILLIVLLIPLRRALSPSVAALAALLIALSPAFAFYSRYYIQEMLLVTFTFAAIVSGYHYFKSKKTVYAVLTGISLGLMHATKETCIIAYFSFAASLALVYLTKRMSSNAPTQAPDKPIRIRHIIFGFIACAAVSVVFFSSWFTNSKGIIDSVLTYADYLHRAGQNPIHIYPWYYYLEMLSGLSLPSGPSSGEFIILLFAIFGLVSVLFRKSDQHKPESLNLLRFILFYTVLTTIFYSMIPYKTPWCLLNFHIGIVIFAAVGIQSAYARYANSTIRLIFVVVMICFIANLGGQSYRANFTKYEDPANPYVYAHSLNDIVRIADKVLELSQSHPDGSNMQIEIICSNSDYWPLPWYLRQHNRKTIGYYDTVDMSIPAAPVIIVSPDNVSDLVKKLFDLPPPGQKHMYVHLFSEPTYLRPNVKIVTFVRKDLFDIYDRDRQEELLREITSVEPTNE